MLLASVRFDTSLHSDLRIDSFKVYKWSINGNISTQLLQPHIRWGLAGLAAVDTLAFLSIAFIRQKSYNLFFYSHVAGFIVFLTAVRNSYPRLHGLRLIIDSISPRPTNTFPLPCPTWLPALLYSV